MVSISLHNEIQKKLIDCDLNFSYFDVTPGDGACWFNAITEIFKLEYYQQLIDDNVKRAVQEPFILRSRIVDFISTYNPADDHFATLKANQLVLLNNSANVAFDENVAWTKYLAEMRHPSTYNFCLSY